MLWFFIFGMSMSSFFLQKPVFSSSIQRYLVQKALSKEQHFLIKCQKTEIWIIFRLSNTDVGLRAFETEPRNAEILTTEKFKLIFVIFYTFMILFFWNFNQKSLNCDIIIARQNTITQIFGHKFTSFIYSLNHALHVKYTICVKKARNL